LFVLINKQKNPRTKWRILNVKACYTYVRFEVSTAVTMMILIFWEMTPCGSYKNRRFGGSYRLHLQGARVRAGYRAKLQALV
jgi:hypothetical protein